jgi:glycosyltransferase involved in cell wall biosynthesis
MGFQEGLDYLLDAAQLLIEQRGPDDVSFALIGSGPEGARLRTRAETMRLARKLPFFGRLRGPRWCGSSPVPMCT